jgi:small subunit ribosomal protein S15
MSFTTTEHKKEVFKNYGGSEQNTGSVEAQVALLTEHINHIANHLRTNKKDHSSTRSLMKMVGKRKRALQYLMKKDITKYRKLIEQLDLRK